MNKHFINTTIGCFFLSFVLYGCSDHCSISFSCDMDRQDNYIIKWEIFPEKQNNKIDIYSSGNDTVFPKDPVVSKPINDYVAVINTGNHSIRNFFRIRAGKCYSGIISNRHFPMDSIQNFRDLGGYFTRSNQQMRWGKIYRSGSLSHMGDNDKNILQALRVKTVIDFRTPEHIQHSPDIFECDNYINLPIEATSFDQNIKNKITGGYFLKGDAVIYTQDCYRKIIDNHSDQYSRFFDILCDESNYPVLFHCGLGKDRTGLASFFLLKALDIPVDIIEEDFLLSNEGINKLQMVKGSTELSEQMQEAMTMIFKADISQLRYAIYCMKKKSGSVEEYMAKELDLTGKKKEILKKILLYNN